MNILVEFILTAIPIGMTLLFGCVGEILTEKAGHLNLGIPGIMCMGGSCGCLALVVMNNALPPALIVTISILAGFLGGVLMGVLYCFLTVTLKANQNVTGLAMTIFGAGTTKFIMMKLAVDDGMKYLYAKDYFRFPFHESTSSLMYCGVMTYLAIIIAIVAAIILTRTRSGLHLRSVGENPATADAVGINITAYKYIATCIGSGIAGLGGLYYIMDYAGSYEAYKKIEALGWLAVALVIFTLWKPVLSIVGSILFGALYQAGYYIPSLQNIQLPISAIPLLKMLPYLVTVVVLIVISVRKKRENQPPASLGLSYFREER